MCCSLLETEHSIECYKTHFQSFKDRVNDPDKPVRPLTAVSKIPAQKKKTLSFRQKGTLNVLSCFKIHREEHTIKTKYFDILAKYFQIILVLVLLDTDTAI